MSRTRASLLAMLIAVMTSAALLALPFTPKVRVHTMTLRRGELIRTVLLSGTVGYERQQLCMNLQEGRISRVYVQPGQRVEAGEMLFRMDTSAQEAALAELYAMQERQKRALAAADESVSALAAQQQSQWLEQEAALRMAIEAACIRAEMDGIVEAVYMEENRLIPAMTLLGAVRGEERCIAAAGFMDELAGLAIGAAGEADGTAVRLRALSAPETESGLQQITFVPLDADEWQNRRIGERVTVEAVVETVPQCVPIPLSAIDRHSRVWVVENGKAYPAEVDLSCRSRDAAAAPLEWEGRRIILQPDESVLVEGCAVKEAKRP